VSAPTCENCGKPRDEHRVVNWSEGQHVGKELEVCPSATWKEAPPKLPPAPRVVHAEDCGCSKCVPHDPEGQW
jgi:hypothetical protein